LRAILDFGFWIADLLYRFALSFFIKLIRRRRTLNPKSKFQNLKFIWRFLQTVITKIVPFGPAVQFLLYVSENVLYIDIIEPVGGQKRKRKINQIWFLNHIWFFLRGKECRKERS